MLYAVPQTDAISEPAMASLVARFLLGCPKPEAFTPIAQATIALELSGAVDDLKAALHDRARGTVTQWDSACDKAVRQIAALGLMSSRGFNRGAGADAEIALQAKRAEAFIDAVSGRDGKGKRTQPSFVCDENFRAEDAPLIHSEERADRFTYDRDQLGGSNEERPPWR